MFPVCMLVTGPGEKKAEEKEWRMVENEALDTLLAAPCLPLRPGQGHGWQNAARQGKQPAAGTLLI